jgi:cellulose synthase/poly-beta-1,6-N-acetylglucosamine synthase-like glycosyltransferase
MALSLPAVALPLFILAVVVIAFSRMPFLQREAKVGSGGLYPRLSVIIPARNEADNLERLLRSLEQQSLRPDEVVVIDDHSVDQTASLAQSLGATVIRAPDLPAGWLGKSWACWLGAQKAKGEVLIFLDADVFFGKRGYSFSPPNI